MQALAQLALGLVVGLANWDGHWVILNVEGRDVIVMVAYWGCFLAPSCLANIWVAWWAFPAEGSSLCSWNFNWSLSDHTSSRWSILFIGSWEERRFVSFKFLVYACILIFELSQVGTVFWVFWGSLNLVLSFSDMASSCSFVMDLFVAIWAEVLNAILAKDFAFLFLAVFAYYDSNVHFGWVFFM